MTVKANAAPPLEERVLILAPAGRNARVAAETLAQEGFHTTICRDASALARAIGAGAGAVLLTDDALYEEDLAPLGAVLQHQSGWSDLPVVLLAWPETGEAALAAVAEIGGNVRLVDRPASLPTLSSAVASALRARRRQYQIRSLVSELRALNEDLEARVAQRTQKVRELATALTRAEERERERIAQILHDHLQQILIAVNIQLRLSASTPGLDPEIRADLAGVEEMVSEAVEAARNLSAELNPLALRQGGLTAGLRWLQEEMGAKHNLDVVLRVGEEAAIADEDLEALLFRAARELLLNVVKHAGSNRATVDLRRQQGRLTLTVADSGKGFLPAEGSDQGSGYGLPSIRERVALHEGSVAVETAPGEGTTVTVTLPL